MLDFFRNHKRLMMFMLILLILPGLGFVGIQNFHSFFDDSINVASVNGHKITRVEYDSAIRQQLDYMRQMLGIQFDVKIFNTPAYRREILDALIQQRILANETQRLYLIVSDDAVRRMLLADPIIASLKKPDGTIDRDRYKELLTTHSMTFGQYDKRIRHGLAIERLSQAIQNSALTPKVLVTRLTRLAQQQREVQKFECRARDYIARVQPDNAQLQAYYDTHHSEFATPATATIQYIVLSPAIIAASVQLTDADLKKHYNANIAHYRTEDEVRASHILITVPQDANALEQQEAKHKAEATLAEVKAHPDQFAQIAQEKSQDLQSAAKGGDLGYFTRGMIVGGEAFDNAVFKLKKNEVNSYLIQTDFGYHIVKVTDLKPSVTKPFNAVKTLIASEIKWQYATKLFTNESEGFSSTVYEHAKSLQPAANKYKLHIQTAIVTPTPNPTLPSSNPLNDVQFLAAVFTDDVLKERNNTQAVHVGNNTLIAARVINYKPAVVPTFDTMRNAVWKKVVGEQSEKLAREDGMAKLAEFQKSNSTDGFSTLLKVSRNDTQSIPPVALHAIYKADAQSLPTYVGVNLGSDGYVIYRVNAIVPSASIDRSQMVAAQQQISQIIGQVQMKAYINALRARSKVKLYGSVDLSS